MASPPGPAGGSPPRTIPSRRNSHTEHPVEKMGSVDEVGDGPTADEELTAQLLDAGALDRGDQGPAPAPSLPSVPLPLLEAQEGAGLPGDAAPPGDSMAQLKNAMSPAKPKQQQFSYRHDDSDTTKSELEEFFSYVEVPGVVAEGRESWARGWTPDDGLDWPDAGKEGRIRFIQRQLAQLEHRDNEQRFEAARRLAYIAQGTPIYGGSHPDYLLLLIIANCGALREAGALQAVYEALKNAGGRWASLAWPTQQERQEYLEEINSELAILLSILYFMIEIFRGDELWAEELMALDPPLPFYLITVVAGLRERNAKGYPVKKLLLVLWKSLLATLGGTKDLNRVKLLVREIEGLPTDVVPLRRKLMTKVSPGDFQSFRQDITSKYPSFDPPSAATPIPGIGLDRIAASAAPQPLRPLYPYHPPPVASVSGQYNEGGQPPPGGPPQPVTPAPSPPPSPKPKKQQYQTDQSRPFVLPFSRVTRGATIPRSIDEAGELFSQHIRLSTELWQTTKVREECLADESGIAYAREPPNGQLNGVHAADGDNQSTLPDSLQMLQAYELDIERQASQSNDPLVRKKLEQRVLDVKRLQRVEQLYRTSLVQMQPAVVVLLKLLLATVTASTGLAALPSVTDEEPAPPVLNLEETDIMRHREITSKAVSAIIIMLLKWFKTSHIMKFQYFAQLIIDSNGLLLILKMFGSQEMATLVKMRSEVEDQNFFHHCYMHGSSQPPLERPEDAMLVGKPASKPSVSTAEVNGNSHPEEDDVELITDFSWRNFFATINFVHILQKLTKRKVHRILLLTQYKAQAILKRMLKINQTQMQVYLLKLIKSQVPYSGRKWRQSNMKVITSIYLNCRPDLRDEWLTGMDVDSDIEDSLPHEQALRTLIKFYNAKHYHAFAPHLARHASQSQVGQSPAAPTFGDGPAPLPSPSPGLHATDEAFPPARPAAHYTRDAFLRSTAYGSENEGYLDDYEEILGDLLTPRYTVDEKGVPSLYPDDGGAQTESAWQRLGEILGEGDDISDSESVASIGFLGINDNDALEAGVEDSEAEGRPQWAEMSPQIITALEEEKAMQQEGLGSPRSPRPRRASSGPKSPALRPVMPMYDREDEAVDMEGDADDEPGPIRAAYHTGPAIDEFEAVFER